MVTKNAIIAEETIDAANAGEKVTIARATALVVDKLPIVVAGDKEFWALLLSELHDKTTPRGSTAYEHLLAALNQGGITVGIKPDA